MKNYIWALIFIFFPLFILRTSDLEEEFTLVSLGFIILGIIFLILAIKGSLAKEKYEEQIAQITSNFDDISKKLDDGMPLTDIAKELKDNKGIPEILTIKICSHATELHVTKNIIPLIIEGQVQELEQRLTMVELLSRPFVGAKQIEEEVRDLDECSNVFHIAQDVFVAKEKDRTKRRTGTIIVTPRFLFPNKISFAHFFKHGKSREAMNQFLGKVPFLGMGLNAFFLIDSLKASFSNKKMFDENKINELLDIAKNNKQFIAIPIKQIKTIELPSKWYKRMFNPYFTIENDQQERFRFFSLTQPDGWQLLDDLFLQLKMVLLLQNKIFIPDITAKRHRWIAWE